MEENDWALPIPDEETSGMQSTRGDRGKFVEDITAFTEGIPSRSGTLKKKKRASTSAVGSSKA